MSDLNTPSTHESDFQSESTFTIRPITTDDHPWVLKLLHRYWASEMIFSNGRLLDASKLQGFAAFRGDEPLGLITYLIEGDSCEIVTHNSLTDSGGIGSCLLAEVRKQARQHNCQRLWLTTTNDNTSALRFYQRRDFDMIALHRNSVHDGRQLKRSIPDRGHADIPIRHEIELEYKL